MSNKTKSYKKKMGRKKIHLSWGSGQTPGVTPKTSFKKRKGKKK